MTKKSKILLLWACLISAVNAADNTIQNVKPLDNTTYISISKDDKAIENTENSTNWWEDPDDRLIPTSKNMSERHLKKEILRRVMISYIKHQVGMHQQKHWTKNTTLVKRSLDAIVTLHNCLTDTAELEKFKKFIVGPNTSDDEFTKLWKQQSLEEKNGILYLNLLHKYVTDNSNSRDVKGIGDLVKDHLTDENTKNTVDLAVKDVSAFVTELNLMPVICTTFESMNNCTSDEIDKSDWIAGYCLRAVPWDGEKVEIIERQNTHMTPLTTCTTVSILGAELSSLIDPGDNKEWAVVRVDEDADSDLDENLHLEDDGANLHTGDIGYSGESDGNSASESDYSYSENIQVQATNDEDSNYVQSMNTGSHIILEGSGVPEPTVQLLPDYNMVNKDVKYQYENLPGKIEQNADRASSDGENSDNPIGKNQITGQDIENPSDQQDSYSSTELESSSVDSDQNGKLEKADVITKPKETGSEKSGQSIAGNEFTSQSNDNQGVLQDPNSMNKDMETGSKDSEHDANMETGGVPNNTEHMGDESTGVQQLTLETTPELEEPQQKDNEKIQADDDKVKTDKTVGKEPETIKSTIQSYDLTPPSGTNIETGSLTEDGEVVKPLIRSLGECNWLKKSAASMNPEGTDQVNLNLLKRLLSDPKTAKNTDWLSLKNASIGTETDKAKGKVKDYYEQLVDFVSAIDGENYTDTGDRSLLWMTINDKPGSDNLDEIVIASLESQSGNLSRKPKILVIEIKVAETSGITPSILLRTQQRQELKYNLKSYVRTSLTSKSKLPAEAGQGQNGDHKYFAYRVTQKQQGSNMGKNKTKKNTNKLELNATDSYTLFYERVD